MAGDSPLNNNIRIDNAHPNFHANEIVAGSCWGGAGSYRLVLAEITNSTAVLTNNVFRDQPCPNTTVDMVKLGAGAAVTIHNNTFQMETCTNCAAKRGFVLVVPSGGANVRNNIFVNAGTANFAKGFGVYETDAAGSQVIFENNALWMPIGGTLYMQNGTSPLLISAINALQGYGGNIEADPLLDATHHLLPGSPCRNAGKTVAVPWVDFDGDVRPQEMSFDIGADECVP